MQLNGQGITIRVSPFDAGLVSGYRVSIVRSGGTINTLTAELSSARFFELRLSNRPFALENVSVEKLYFVLEINEFLEIFLESCIKRNHE